MSTAVGLGDPLDGRPSKRVASGFESLHRGVSGEWIFPMKSEVKNELGFQQVKAISLAVTDMERAKRFYGETLGLEAEGSMDSAFFIGNVFLLLKPVEEW